MSLTREKRERRAELRKELADLMSDDRAVRTEAKGWPVLLLTPEAARRFAQEIREARYD